MAAPAVLAHSTAYQRRSRGGTERVRGLPSNVRLRRVVLNALLGDVAVLQAREAAHRLDSRTVWAERHSGMQAVVLLRRERPKRSSSELKSAATKFISLNSHLEDLRLE